MAPRPCQTAPKPLYFGMRKRRRDARLEMTGAATYSVCVRGEKKSADRGAPGLQLEIRIRPETKIQKPKRYRIVMLNDDYTPMEFVVHVLQRFFGMPEQRAIETMLKVHREGQALVGVFSFEIAETKVSQVIAFARHHQHPLRCKLEAEP